MGTRCADHVTPLYPQKLVLTLPTGGGRSVGIVRSRTKAMEFSLVFNCKAESTDMFSLVTTGGRTDPCLVLTVHIERSAFQLICVGGEVERMWKCSRYMLRFCAAALGTSD